MVPCTPQTVSVHADLLGAIDLSAIEATRTPEFGGIGRLGLTAGPLSGGFDAYTLDGSYRARFGPCAGTLVTGRVPSMFILEAGVSLNARTAEPGLVVEWTWAFVGRNSEMSALSLVVGVEHRGPSYGTFSGIFGVSHDVSVVVWTGITGDATGSSEAAGIGARYWYGWKLRREE